MKDTDLAYLAGLFDGEGDVAIYKVRASKNRRFYLRAQIRITNTHKGVLEWVQMVVGSGNINQEGRVGGHRKPCFRWQLTGLKAVDLMRCMSPHLRIKAEKVTAILSGPVSGPA